MLKPVVKLVTAFLTLAMGGCATFGYYGQSISGHFGVMAQARPIDEVLDNGASPPQLKGKLQHVLAVRDFATAELGLRDNRSYRTYADIRRPYVVWNVFAAREFSLEPKTWCFLVVGCVSYRGYYDERRAEAFAAELQSQGYDAFVGGVPAYSTLGWFDDPVLNTMLEWDDNQLARLIFHELAHQQLFVRNDTEFNESFATAVENIGMLRWLKHGGDGAAVATYLRQLDRRSAMQDLIARTRDRLAALYKTPAADSEKRRRKAEIFTDMRREYHVLRESWGGFAGYDGWFDLPLNNARFVAVSAYHTYVPAFLYLYQQSGGDMPAFYREVTRLASLTVSKRKEMMEHYAAQGPKLQDLAQH